MRLADYALIEPKPLSQCIPERRRARRRKGIAIAGPAQIRRQLYSQNDQPFATISRSAI
jgi:hypothetical protein